MYGRRRSDFVRVDIRTIYPAPKLPIEIFPDEHISGERRTALGLWAKDLYEHQWSIRDIRDEINRSYGFVRRMLLDAGCRLRTRGGDRSSERYLRRQ